MKARLLITVVVMISICGACSAFATEDESALPEQIAAHTRDAMPQADQQALEENPAPKLSLFGSGSSKTSLTASEPSTMSTSAMVTRVVLGLGLVMGLLGAVLFLYKKATHGRPSGLGKTGIQVLTQRGLGQKTHLAVVQVGGETLLLGVTPHQISTLSKLAPAPAAIAGDSFRGGEKQIPLDESMPNPPLERDELYLKADQEQGFERTLAKEVKRVRNSLWTSLKRLET